MYIQVAAETYKCNDTGQLVVLLMVANQGVNISGYVETAVYVTADGNIRSKPLVDFECKYEEVKI